MFGCRLMVFCGDKASVGFLSYFFHLFVSNCSELTVAPELVIFWVNTQLSRKFLDYLAALKKALKN